MMVAVALPAALPPCGKTQRSSIVQHSQLQVEYADECGTGEAPADMQQREGQLALCKHRPGGMQAARARASERRAPRALP